MTHVVSEACIRCKYTDCVEVCPVDCFHEGPNFLTIDPDECIDCAVCIPECPVGAIYAEEDTPADQQHMIKLNAELARLPLVYLPLGALTLWLLGQIAVFGPARRAASVPPAIATRSA